jgi:ribosome assembly protein YihI (activator of Der GTPase)
MSLEILRKGLTVFKKHVKKRKDALLEHLKQSEKISEEDADWLDNQANHVDEEALIHNLETAVLSSFGHETRREEVRAMVNSSISYT